MRIIPPGENGRIGSTGRRQDRSTGDLGTVTATGTGATPTRGEPLTRDLGVGRLRDGIETSRTCRLRKQSGSSIMPGGGSTVTRMKLVPAVMSLRSCFLQLVAKGQTEVWQLLPTPSCTRRPKGLGSQEAARVLADSTGGTGKEPQQDQGPRD